MKSVQRGISHVVVVCVFAGPSFADDDALDPFFTPRAYSYGESSVAEAADNASFIRLVGRDFKNLVTTKENFVILGAGLGAAWGASHYDNAVVASPFNSEVAGGTSLDRVFESGEFAGDGFAQVGTAIIAFGLGKAFRSRGIEELGRDLLRAQIVSGTLTLGIKAAVGRQRPDSPSQSSFPSGHTSSAFATASVLQRRYGWGAGVPAYAFAGYVAGSRLNESRHFLSDVIFGAAIGIVSGRTVTVELARERFALGPMLVPGGGAGIQLTWLGGNR